MHVDVICSNMVHCVHQAHDLVAACVERAWRAIWLDCRCHRKGSSGNETADALWRRLHDEKLAGQKPLELLPQASNDPHGLRQQVQGL